MSYRISETTKQRTTQCHYNFECLNKDNWNTCTIEEGHDGGLAVKDKCKHKFCTYTLYFGSLRSFCICPARCEIYKHYRK